MGEPERIERRLTSIESRLDNVESRLETVATDAAAGRYLAAAHDRDLADVSVKVDANRRAINALGEQTAAGFAEVRAKLDQTAAGQEQIVGLLNHVIALSSIAEPGGIEQRLTSIESPARDRDR